MKNVFVTGAAGFIGFHLCRRLLGMGINVIGFDSINDYYDPRLKMDRLAMLEKTSRFNFVKGDLADSAAVEAVFCANRFDTVVHLAAQAGVRYSLHNPHAYIASNINGFLNILEACRQHGVGHLVYGSSSSVYGANSLSPFSVHHNADHPISLYAATKKSNELMAHSYSSLYGLPTTGLRFFTVYGPWGRPDMAYFSFTKAIVEGRPIDVYNHGNMRRDFTYIDDIVEGIVRTCRHIPVPDPAWNSEAPDPGSSYAPYRIYNIGNNCPVELIHFVQCLEKLLGREAVVNLLPLQPGDVLETCADVDDLMRDVGFSPTTPLEQGLAHFVEWYRGYYHV